MSHAFPHHPPSFSAQWTIHWLGLLALGLAISGNLFLEHGRLETREREHLLLQTRIVQQLIGQHLTALNAVLADLRQQTFPLAAPADTNRRLTILAKALSGVRSLSILDAQGIVRASSDPASLGQDRSQRPSFTAGKQIHDPGVLAIIPPDRTSGDRSAMTATREIQGPNGAFGGLVAATLTPDFFTPLLGSVLYAPDMWSGVAHADAAVLPVLLEQADNLGTNPDQPAALFTRHLATHQETSVFDDSIQATGEHRLVAVRTIHPPDLRLRAPLLIAISRDHHAVHAGWRRDTLFQGGALAVVALFSTLVLLAFQKWQRENAREMAQATAELARRDRFIRTVADNAPAQIAYWNADLQCEYANTAYLDWFGKNLEEIRSLSMQELLGEALFAQSAPFMRAALEGASQVFERNLVKADGTAGSTLVRYVPDRVDGQVRGIYVLVSDVTELKATQQELERRIQELDILATTDVLTGISNRRHLLEQTKDALAHGQRYGDKLAFLMIDVDHFKAVNDTHGHDIGDATLRALADTLCRTMRTTDRIGRLGGEEFGVLLLHTDGATARAVAERLRQALSETRVPTPSGSLSFTVSIGLAVVDETVQSVEELMKRADLALYQAKETGRDRVCGYGLC